MIQSVRGFKDILPGDVEVWQKIEKEAIRTFEDFGFSQISLPIIEKTDLFARSIGDNTDIVEKEMYTFEDRGGEKLTLRPEATAGVVRSCIQHKLYAKDPIQKLYTIGPMFRRERPQKGRYRQFYQINAEVFGIASPYIDAQLIYMLSTLFDRLAVSNIKIHINSLGCPNCRPLFQKNLIKFLTCRQDTLCDNCKRRSITNPLRVIDCKSPLCRDAVKDAPSIIDFLCDKCNNHFDTVKQALDDLDVPFVMDKHLVRGLDYYTSTTFEIQTTAMGAQNAIAGGGRYDGLIEQLGGQNQPAVGFAIGFDRLSEIVSLNTENLTRKPDLFVIAMGKKAQAKAFIWSSELNVAGVFSAMDFSDRSLKSLMKRAGKLNASYVLIAGEKELDLDKIIIRNMNTREQSEVSKENVVKTVKAMVLKKHFDKSEI